MFFNLIKISVPGCDDDLVLANPNECRYPGDSCEFDDGGPRLGVKITDLYLPLGVMSLGAAAGWPFLAPDDGTVFDLFIS